MNAAISLAVVGGILAFALGGRAEARAASRPKRRSKLSKGEQTEADRLNALIDKVVKRARTRPTPPAMPPKPTAPSAKPPVPKAGSTAQATGEPGVVLVPIGPGGQLLELDLNAPTPEQQTAMDQFLRLPSPAGGAVQKPLLMTPATKPKPKAKPKPPVKMGPLKLLKRTPKQAALDLLKYVTGTKPNFGVKGAPSPTVRAAQIDMGVTPDGIYGPTTRNAGRELTGKAFPPRR